MKSDKDEDAIIGAAIVLEIQHQLTDFLKNVQKVSDTFDTELRGGPFGFIAGMTVGNKTPNLGALGSKEFIVKTIKSLMERAAITLEDLK